MENLCWGAPILPGKLEQWHRFHDEMQGARREEHAASRREMGIHREVVSPMETPDVAFVSLYHEAEGLGKAFHVLATSESPYLQWFRKQIAEIHGLTPEMLLGPPPSKLIMDWQG
jgi:hypothetical protein